MFNCGNYERQQMENLSTTSETEPLLVSDVLLFNSTEMQTDVDKDGNGTTASNSQNAGLPVTT